MTTRVIVSPAAAAHLDRIRDRIRQQVAEEIAADARQMAPVDTGYLASHINPHDGGRRVVAEGAGIPPSREAPVYVELGTRHMRASPYLRPAAYRKRVIRYVGGA